MWERKKIRYLQARTSEEERERERGRKSLFFELGFIFYTMSSIEARVFFVLTFIFIALHFLVYIIPINTLLLLLINNLLLSFLFKIKLMNFNI